MRVVALIALAAGLTSFASFAEAHDSSAEASAKAAAEPPKAVVELYTSQGCSSCPAADALLNKLAQRKDLIAISLSVDYWDYLGWKDTLANAKFSERQKAYAKALGDGMVYTPQVVVNGEIQVNGADESKIAAAIQNAAASHKLAEAPVRLTFVGGKLVVEVGAAPAGSPEREATVWLAVMSPKVEVPIARGENKGKTITYSHVVRELIPIGTWNGDVMTVKLHREAIMPAASELCAVLVQDGRGGPIIGAALTDPL
jgi:hypothetical protein